MAANDEEIITLLTPERAVETLEKMIGQLETVIHHFSEQKNVSAATKARTVAEMGDQLEAMRMGVLALKALRETGLLPHGK